jgi:hypothetical protein
MCSISFQRTDFIVGQEVQNCHSEHYGHNQQIADLDRG